MAGMQFISIPEYPSVRFYAEVRLICWFPTGVLDDERADQLLDFIEARELHCETGFNRYLDMSGYDRLQISLDHVVRLARRRRAKYHGPTVNCIPRLQTDQSYHRENV